MTGDSDMDSPSLYNELAMVHKFPVKDKKGKITFCTRCEK